jgi:hypothetical protein
MLYQYKTNTSIVFSFFLLFSLLQFPLFAQFTQQGNKLVGTGYLSNNPQQGYSTALSADGNTMIEGAYGENNGQGAAWVFTRTNGIWSQQGVKLVGTGSQGGLVWQGLSVALSADGNTAAVGGELDNNWRGAVWIFTRTNGVWTQQGAKLTANDGTDSSTVGQSVALSADGNTLIAGGGVDSYSPTDYRYAWGAAHIFTRTNGIWTQQGPKLSGTGSIGAATQGTSVAISADGNTAAIGGAKDDNDKGATWVFTRTGTTWTQQGTKLVGTTTFAVANQGWSVAISADGNTIMSGGIGDENNKGAAWVFTRSGSLWTQQGSKLVSPAPTNFAAFGFSVSLSNNGNQAIIGAPQDDNFVGGAWVYARTGSTWASQGVKLLGTGANSPAQAMMGSSVTISTDASTIAMGSSADNAYIGATWIFTNTVAANCIPTITGNTTLCGGNSTVLTASSGYSTYIWSNATNTQTNTVTAAGTYYVTATNSSGCSGTASITIAIASGLNTPIITGRTYFCGANLPFLDAGAGYSSYRWSNGRQTQTISPTSTGTYTVTVTQTGGCTATASVVASNGIVPPIITGNTTICQGGSAILDAGPGFDTYRWITGDNTRTTLIYAPTNGGIGINNNYYVTVTSAGGCTATSLIVTTSILSPTPTITGTPAICSGNPAFIAVPANATYTSFLWSNGITTRNNTVSTPGTYTVTITTNNGCTGTTSVNVTTNNNVGTPTSITTTSAICAGSPTTIGVPPNGTDLGYSWSNGTNNRTTQITQAGVYSVTVTQSTGCTASASTLVSARAAPTPTISGTTAICAGASTTLTVPLNNADISYSWSNGITTNTNTVSQSGIYTVTVTNSGGCTGTSSVNITNSTSPIPTITGGVGICNGASATLSVPLNATDVAYAWSNNVTTRTITTIYPGTYIVTVTNSSGCTGTARTTVSAIPTPSASINGNGTSICGGASAIISVITDATANTFLWSNGSTTRFVTINTIGTYTVTVTNSSGCTATASTQIIASPSPSPTITSSTNGLCLGSTATLSVPINATYAEYAWSNGDTTRTTPISNAGTYTVTVTNIAGCEASATITIASRPSPTPTIQGGNISICPGASATLSVPINAADISYQWSNGTASRTNIATLSGTYTVTVTNSNGCTATSSSSITNFANSSASIQGPSTFCSGSTNTLDAGIGYTAYAWSTGANTRTININTAGAYSVTVTNVNGCTASAGRGIIINPSPTPPTISGILNICPNSSTNIDAGAGFATYSWSNAASARIINVSAGTYTVTVTTQSGCTTTSSTTVSALATTPITISSSSTFCTSTSAILEASPGFTTYIWSNGTTTQSNNIILGATGTTTTYTVTATAANGCTTTASRQISPNAPPTISISGIATICSGSSATLTASSNTTNSTFNWSGGTGLLNTPIVQVSQAGTYTVTVTNTSGCTNSATRTVIASPAPTVSLTGMPPTIRVNSPNATLRGTPTGGSYTGRGMQGSIFNPSIAGVGPDTLTYTYTDATTGCTGSARIIINVDTRSVATNDQQATTNEIRLYPNPVTDELNIEISEAQQPTNYELRITNVLGQEILKYTIDFIDKKANINTSTLTNGTYILTITDQQGRVGVSKFVKK